MEYCVNYNVKDLILYALSIGMGLPSLSSTSTSTPTSSSSSSDGDDDDNNDDGKVDEGFSKDTRFLYEQHSNFSSVPTFCLTFPFWAQECQQQQRQNHKQGTRSSTSTTTSTMGIPSFPPPLMASVGIIPKQYLKKDKDKDDDDDEHIDLSIYPVLHTWQSIVWHENLPVPAQSSSSSSSTNNVNDNDTQRHDTVIETKLRYCTVSVVPKSIGTYVTTQSEIIQILPIDDHGQNDNYYRRPVQQQQNNGDNNNNNNTTKILCTMQSTALVLGLSEDNVIPYDSGIPILSSIKKTTKKKIHQKETQQQQRQQQRRSPDLVWSYTTHSSQALLYRIASGDSNHIHVDTSVSQMLSGTTTQTVTPILHGLLTLAIVFRAILQFHDDADKTIVSLEGKFRKPAFVEDTLTVKIWKDDDDVIESIRDTITTTSTTTTTKTNNHNNHNHNMGAKKRNCYTFVVDNAKTGTRLVDSGRIILAMSKTVTGKEKEGMETNAIRNEIISSKL